MQPVANDLPIRFRLWFSGNFLQPELLSWLRMCTRGRSGKPSRKIPRRSSWTCRTDAEWNFVGLPDLSPVGKQVVPIQWQVYPTMAHNAAFADQLKEAGFTAEHRIYFICRSGQRSFAAAQAAQAAGFPHAYNVADGFEGGVDAAGHRGAATGWKAKACPGGNDRLSASR